MWKLLLFGCLCVLANVTLGQKNQTILYQHYYNVFEFNGRISYTGYLFGGLYLQSDTMSVYRMAWEQKDLRKNFDLSSKDAHHGYIRSLTNFTGYEIINQGKDHAFVQDREDSIPWTLTEDTATLLGHLCKTAFKDSVIAWYAPSIDSKAGPFGYYGLPGLILKVYNLRHRYMVEAKSIESTIPQIICSQRMLYTTVERYSQLKRAVVEQKQGRKVQWFWQR